MTSCMSSLRAQRLRRIDVRGPARRDEQRKEHDADHHSRGGGENAGVYRTDAEEHALHGAIRGPGAEDA